MYPVPGDLDALISARLVLADGDHGYGNAMNVQRTVRAYGNAGAAAVLIEDKVTPRALTAAGKPCLSRSEAQMKIRAAVEAAKADDLMRSEPLCKAPPRRIRLESRFPQRGAVVGGSEDALEEPFRGHRHGGGLSGRRHRPGRRGRTDEGRVRPGQLG